MLISGGGKCNVTHDGPMEDLRTAFPPRAGRFLKGAFHAFTNTDIRALLASAGVRTAVRENGRVFPVEGFARNVVDALLQAARSKGVKIASNSHVEGVVRDSKGIVSVVVNGEQIASRNVLIATGGISYRKTGTTGDGITWAGTLGHTIIPLRPALAPIGVRPRLPQAWRGVAIRGGRLSVSDGSRLVRSFDGDILFSHEGISGPAALEVSNAAAVAAEHGRADLVLDFFPVTDARELDARLLAAVQSNKGKMIGTILDAWLPNRLVPDLLQQHGVDPATRGHSLTGEARKALVHMLKGWIIGAIGRIDIDRGEVTAGGVSLDEVDPRTMQSRLVPGLYFAGEVLDIDGPVGGYNLQAAFSTGVLAGEKMSASSV